MVDDDDKILDYKKYKGKYTSLCIYIDNTVYERDADNNPIALRKLTDDETKKVFNALMDFIIGVAVHHYYFGDYYDETHPQNKINYNEFQIIFASRMFLRLTDERQDFSEIVDVTNKRRGRKNLAPIKSCKNYMEGVMGKAVQDYRNKYFNQVYDQYTIADYNLAAVDQENQYKRDTLYLETFEEFDSYIEKTLNHSIYRKNKKVRNDLKLSIQLSLLNVLTFAKEKELGLTQLFDRLNEREKYIIVWGEKNFLTKEIVLVYIIRVFRYVHQEFDIIEATTYIPEDIVSAMFDSAIDPDRVIYQYNEEQ